MLFIVSVVAGKPYMSVYMLITTLCLVYLLAGLVSSCAGMLAWMSDQQQPASAATCLVLKLLRAVLSRTFIAVDDSSLLPLLQQLQRCCRALREQLTSAAAAAAAASDGSGGQLPSKHLEQAVLLLGVQQLLLERCVNPSVAGDTQQQLWLWPGMADAGMQLLAVACCGWQQRLTTMLDREAAPASMQGLSQMLSGQGDHASAEQHQQQQLVGTSRQLLPLQPLLLQIGSSRCSSQLIRLLSSQAVHGSLCSSSSWASVSGMFSSLNRCLEATAA
jgi:hypothetical protein